MVWGLHDVMWLLVRSAPACLSAIFELGAVHESCRKSVCVIMCSMARLL